MAGQDPAGSRHNGGVERLVDTAALRELYRQLLRIRMVEEAIADLYPEQEMRCPVHLCIGQEAVAVGVCANLRREDAILSGHRSHGHYLAKGGDLKAMFAELYGKATGCCGGKGGSMHLVDLAAGFLGAAPIVGSTIPIAAGAAFGFALRGEAKVAVAFFGDGAVEQGVVHETLNFAALKNLPIVFVCENNLYSVYSPLEVRQPPGREIYQIAAAHGVTARQADGNDVLEVHALAGEAVAQARSGGGPTFLEFMTYRSREHCGPNYDNDLGYRTESEANCWGERCPVCGFGERLQREAALSADDMQTLADDIAREIAEAVSFAKSSPYPETTQMCAHVYAP